MSVHSAHTETVVKELDYLHSLPPTNALTGRTAKSWCPIMDGKQLGWLLGFPDTDDSVPKHAIRATGGWNILHKLPAIEIKPALLLCC